MNGRPRPDVEVGERELAGPAAPICEVCRVPAIAHKNHWQCGGLTCPRAGESLGQVAATLGYPQFSRRRMPPPGYHANIRRARILAAGNERRRLEALADQAYRVAVDVALEELEAAPHDVGVAGAARLAGVHRSSIYNAQAKRQDHRDTLDASSSAPAPAPHDDDRPENTTNGRTTA